MTKDGMTESPIQSKDAQGRIIDYMRIAVTDRCNLRCIYCMPYDKMPKLSHEDLLTYEELERLTKIAISLGITKIRITGGEPLVRKGIIDFVRKVVGITGPGRVSMTTNGTLLYYHAKDLFKAGIKRINISLDTLQKDKFFRITRRNCFEDVMEGIQETMKIGFKPVKLNVVVLKGINDDEVEDLARLTMKEDLHVRFIEFMPFNKNAWSSLYTSSSEIVSRLKALGQLEKTTSVNSNGPARYFKIKGYRGKIGVISPISSHFCESCNRLRLTPEGSLRTCLFSSKELNLKDLIRRGQADDVIREAIIKELKNKPAKHDLNNEVFRKCIARPMSTIGG